MVRICILPDVAISNSYTTPISVLPAKHTCSKMTSNPAENCFIDTRTTFLRIPCRLVEMTTP